MNYQYISDQKGNKKAVIVPIKDFKKMLEDLDELEAIKEYDEAKSEKLSFRSLEEALNHIEANKAKK